MSDALTYTAADMRAAYFDGVMEHARVSFATECDPLVWPARGAIVPASEAAAKRWPDPPPPTRPRVVRDPVSKNGREWRFVEGEFQTRVPYTEAKMSEWHDANARYIESTPSATPERVVVWADLLANPTEPVPPAAAGEGAPA